ncbi:MAG: T9SS type A sorting domain-containing protein [Candidatus Cloacimonetes bacterium]|nr:T9SS type A sorting domain-containing protein [Candidatus Cloacimonadota bacterium]
MKKIFVTILIFTFVLSLATITFAKEGQSKANATYKVMNAHINDSTGMIDAVDVEIKIEGGDPYPEIIDTLVTNYWENLNSNGLCKNPGDPGGEGIRIFKNFPDTSNPANEIQGWATTGCKLGDNKFRVYFQNAAGDTLEFDPCANIPMGLGFVDKAGEGMPSIDIYDGYNFTTDILNSWWPEYVQAPDPAFTAITLQDSLDGCASFPYWNTLVNDGSYHDTDTCDYNYHWGKFILNVNEDPSSEYYIDLADGYDTDVNFKLQDDGYFPFYLDTSSPAVDTDFYNWWAAKGVVSGATGWQGHMWDIINGVEPMMYVYYDENGTSPPIYKILDGLQYWSGNEEYLKVNGDYPQGVYNFHGQIMGCNDEMSDSVFVQLDIQGCDNPEVVDITTNTTLIDDCTDSLQICIEFDDIMNTYIDPDVTFDPTDAEDFLTTAMTWFRWSSNTTYCMTYYFSTKPDTAIFGIDVSVDGAVNEYCCPQVPYMEQDVFDIYTLNPTGTISFNHDVIDNCVDTFEVTVCYDDSMCLNVPPSLTMYGSTTNLLNFVSSSWLPNDSCYTWVYEVQDTSMIGTIGVEVTGAQNWTCCNVQEMSYSDFYVDTEIPIPDVMHYPYTVNGCFIDSTFTVTAYYSDSMCTSVDPDISFDPNVDHTLSFDNSSWINNYTYEWNYTILDADTTIYGVQYIVSGAMDWTCCNMQEPDTSYFDINTDSPVVDNVTVSDTLLTLCSTEPFTICVTYDRAMDPSYDPTITFDPTNVDSILTACGGWSDGVWVSDSTFCMDYSWYCMPEVDIEDIDILVSGARGILDTCSIQEDYTEYDKFDIDWDRPEVIDIMVSDDCVGSCDTAFTVTVEYDEAMCNSPLPTITFDDPVLYTNPFTFDSGSWLDDFTAEINYTVSDSNAFGCDVDVIVTDAIDETCCAANVQYPDTLFDAFNVDQYEPYSALTNADYIDSTCTLVADWWIDDSGCPSCIEKLEFYIWKEGGTPTLVYTDTSVDTTYGSESFDLTTYPGVDTMCVEGMWYGYTKAYDCCCNIEEVTGADDSVDVTIEATHFIVEAYDHNTGSDTLREGKYFDVEITAVNDCGLRDCDFEACIEGCTNYNEAQVDLTLFSNPTMMYDGHLISEHNVANMTMNDLIINVWKCPCCDMYSSSDSITVLLPEIEPPTNTAAYDVPNDQGGWISIDYTLSLQDPFHSTHDPMLNPVYQPFIDYYVVERNTEVDTSGTWNAIAFVDLYNPSVGDDAHVDIQVPASNDMYPYRMAAVYNYGSTLFKEHGENSPKVVYANDMMEKGAQQSNYADCGSAAAKDNIPAFANMKVFLEGPYQTGGYMTDDIDLPTTSPYSGEDIGTLPTVSGRILIDWIYVELRNSETGATVQEADAFVLDNGMIINTNGEYSLPFFYTTGNEYYIVIHHRNHLDIMTSDKQAFGDSESAPTSIDITIAGSAYNDGFKEVETGVYALYAGDASDNNQVQNDDKNDYWKYQVGQAGYLSADFNLNGQVQNDDKNDFWKYNVGYGSAVPDQAKANANNQAQKGFTTKAGVTFTFANGTIDSGNFEFDVMIQADASGNYLGDNQVYFNYNPAAFGLNIVANSKVEVTKSTMLQGDISGSPLYSLVNMADNSSSRAAITYGYNYPVSPSWANEIPTTPEKLFHVQIDIADNSENSELTFQEDLMSDQIFSSDNSTKFGVTATDELDETLPIELLAFTALYSDINENVEINWTTASENDVTGFNIYRSQDEIIPDERANADLIDAAGTSTEQQEYQFEDYTASITNPYNYWLEAINFDGSSDFHGPIAYIPGDTDGDGTSDYTYDATRLVGNFPNPVVNNTTIEYQIKGSIQNQKATIKLYNIRGELVKTLQGSGGKATLNTSDLGQGIYFYRLQTNNYSNTKKLVIVK